ncbi:MAG: fumarate hydratase [Cellulosilyticaceae bacterium]
MKRIHVDRIVEQIRETCKEANCRLPYTLKLKLEESINKEESGLGRSILKDICDNINIAEQESMPICQDTGSAVFFIKLGQEVYIEGGSLEGAINEGVKQGYEEGYLRKSIVVNPIYRVNTKDNTPAIIHYEIVPGEELQITFSPKGGGSENMSRVYMLTPSQGIKGIEKAVLETVELAGPNACLPMIVGIGIGGNFEKSTLLAKKALMREVGEKNQDPRMAEIEEDLLNRINQLGIGPQGLGGTITALGVHVETYPCHIASMPVAINIGCHVNRHKTIIL